MGRLLTTAELLDVSGGEDDGVVSTGTRIRNPWVTSISAEAAVALFGQVSFLWAVNYMFNLDADGDGAYSPEEDSAALVTAALAEMSDEEILELATTIDALNAEAKDDFVNGINLLAEAMTGLANAAGETAGELGAFADALTGLAIAVSAGTLLYDINNGNDDLIGLLSDALSFVAGVALATSEGAATGSFYGAIAGFVIGVANGIYGDDVIEFAIRTSISAGQYGMQGLENQIDEHIITPASQYTLDDVLNLLGIPQLDEFDGEDDPNLEDY